MHDKRLGSFEKWSAVMGGVLEVAGISGFLGNLNELYAGADTDGQMWREFTGAWWEAYREEPKRVSELNQLCEDHDPMLAVRGDGATRSQQTRLTEPAAHHLHFHGWLRPKRRIRHGASTKPVRRVRA